jgi:hypothetical protein
MLEHCPECGCHLAPYQEVAVPISPTATQDLSVLELTKEELAILTEMQKSYKVYKLYEHQNPEYLNQKRLNEIRGLKYAYDAIINTYDGKIQSYNWQAVLY